MRNAYLSNHICFCREVIMYRAVEETKILWCKTSSKTSPQTSRLMTN